MKCPLYLPKFSSVPFSPAQLSTLDPAQLNQFPSVQSSSVPFSPVQFPLDHISSRQENLIIGLFPAAMYCRAKYGHHCGEVELAAANPSYLQQTEGKPHGGRFHAM